jgi:peptidoglycan hydrolase-like protein with peptidoglycan-binding domain
MYGPAHDKGPTRGGDVINWKRALSRWDSDIFPWKQFDEVFNKKTVAATKVFQKREGLSPATGYVGRPTFAKMKATHKQDRKTGEWAFDAFGIAAHNAEMREYLGVYKEDEQRKELQLLLFKLHDLRDAIDYSQHRPVSAVVYAYAPERIRILDCSGMAIYVYWRVGAPSPDPQYGYTGYGNTWSLSSDSGNRFYEANVKIGDLAFYGSSISHVAVVAALNPIRVVSHGSAWGPSYYDLKYRSDFRFFHRKRVIK